MVGYYSLINSLSKVWRMEQYEQEWFAITHWLINEPGKKKILKKVWSKVRILSDKILSSKIVLIKLYKVRLHHFHNLPLKPALPNKCNLSLPAPGWCGSWWARDGFHLPGRSQVQPHHWQSIKGSWSFGLYGKVKRNVNWIHCWYFRLWQNAGRVKSWKCTTMGENQWKSMCNKSILKTSNVWNNCMRKKWWSRLKFPSVAKNNLSKMRTVMFCATFVLHFLICIISSIYFAFPILWQYSERLQWPHSPNPKNYIPSQHKWSACLSEIFCIPPSPPPTRYLFYLLLNFF